MLHDIKKRGRKDTVKKFILDTFQERRNSLQELHRTWMLNLAWTRGFQNVDYDLEKKTWNKQVKQPWRPRLISNLMLPIVRGQVSQLVSTSNVWDHIPATSDEEDIQISTTANQVLLHYWQTMDMPKVLIRLAFWQSVCGSVFLKVGWNADIGDDVEKETRLIDDELLQQFFERAGITEQPKSITVKSGDLSIDVITPFNLTLDPSAAVLQDSTYAIESNLRSKDWVIEHFGNKYKDLPETDEQDLFIYPFVRSERQNKGRKQGVLIHELYIKETKNFPDGLHAILTHSGEMIVSPEPSPFNHKQLPYTHFLEIYDPGSLHGTSTTEQIRPLQGRYNRVSSSLLEHINLMSQVQWFNPRQSGVQGFTNKPGAEIRYNHPYKPEQSQPKSMPAYVERFLDRTRSDIQDVASSHDVTEGKAEPGIRSGKAVLALQDADDSVKGPTLLWWDTSLAETGRLALQTLSQFVTEDRILQIRGQFSELETVTFNGSILNQKEPNKDYFKVRVKTYGRQPLSRSAREGLARTLVELQLVTDKETLLQILGAADLISVFDENSIDRVRQFKEIQEIIKGESEGVRVWFGQNHDVHERAIKKFIASSKWDKLDDQIKTLISQHLQQHIEQKTLEAIFPQFVLQGLINGPSRGTEGRQDRGTEGRQDRGTEGRQDRGTRGS